MGAATEIPERLACLQFADAVGRLRSVAPRRGWSLVGYVTNWARKAIDRLSHLPVVPLLLLGHFPRLLMVLLRLLPVRWPAGERVKWLRVKIGALVLLRYDQPEQAYFWMQRLLESGHRSREACLLAAVCLYQGLGRLREATALFARTNPFRAETARSIGPEKDRYRVLDDVWARHIGDLATVDYVIKQDILDGRRPEDIIFYVPPGGRIGNRFLLRQFAQRLRLVESSADLPFDASAVPFLNHHYQFPQLPDGTTTYFWELASKVHRRWHSEGRGPLLQLPPEIATRGWALLKSVGIPESAWFVVLHLRDSRWKGLATGMHGIRNVDPATYLPAIAEITDRGGWVIRIGDADSTPFPPIANFFDYCRSELRADWMDIFLLAQCRFMLGTNSGPCFVPPLYGNSVVLTNWLPPGMRPWHASDIFVPKLLRRQSDGRYLKLSQTLREPLSHCHSRRYLAEYGGITVEDADAELIRGAVLEMLSRLDGHQGSHDEVVDLRVRADRIYQENGNFGMAALARDFLRRHEDLIA
jgi:putative glycosyltransferase (TIGR04372 family)